MDEKEVKSTTSYPNFLKRFVEIYNPDKECECTCQSSEASLMGYLDGYYLPFDHFAYVICDKHKPIRDEIEEKYPDVFILHWMRADMYRTYYHKWVYGIYDRELRNDDRERAIELASKINMQWKYHKDTFKIEKLSDKY